jgi:hypothetical protein
MTGAYVRKVAIAVLVLAGTSAALASTAWSASSARLCPSFCGARGGPELVAVRQLHGAIASVGLLLASSGPVELVVERSIGGRLASAQATVVGRDPQVTLTGRVPVGDRRRTVADIRLRFARAGPAWRTVKLSGRARSLPAGDYVVTASSLTSAGNLRRPGSSVVLRLLRDGQLVYLLEPYTAPGASTGAARVVAQTTATIGGTVDPYGQTTSYSFEYGPTASYGAQTASQPVARRRKRLAVAANLTGLSLTTAYHYRLVATTCSGCPWGTSYGPDRTLTTKAATGLSQQQVDADRAVSTYNVMQSDFYAANAYPGDSSGLYIESSPQGGNRYSYLWPFSRALVGTVTLAGIPAALLGGASYQSDVANRLAGLARYWDGTGYDSYPVAPFGNGGDKYYDDQAWVGLAAAQTYAMSGNPSALSDAESAFNFVYPGGWAAAAGFEPGGIYWVNQGVGVGVNNHDRTTTSNAPNAELALLLGAADPASASSYDNDAALIYGWVNQFLYNVPTSPNYAPSQPALMFDKVVGNNTIDHTLWTYNQGTMIAADVREYQLTGQATYLSQAESIATTALHTFTETSYLSQPAAFDAIFFRGLLVLYSATSDGGLRAQIVQTVQTYADDAWNNYRSPAGLFRFPSTSGSGDQLLDQGAMVEIYAALAWNPADYDKLP